MAKRPTPGGYTAIPNEVKDFLHNDSRRAWAIALVGWWYDHTRGDTCRATYDQARAYLADLPWARTRQGTVPSRWAIARFMDDLRDKGYLSTDRKQNRAEGARFGCCTFNLAAWIKNIGLRLKRVLHGSATRPAIGETPSKQAPVLHGSATPVQDDLLSEEKRAHLRAQAIAARARCGLPALKTA